MPVHKGINTRGPYYQWGKHGKKYYYKKGYTKSRLAARKKAERQAKAIFASGYRGK